MGNYVTCAQAVADKSAQASKDAAQDAAIANAAGAGAAAVTPAAVLAQVQNMSPAQIAAMCAKLNCAPTAAALTQSLLSLGGSGVVGNVLAISAAGVASWVPDKQTELLASGPGYRAIRHSDGTIVQYGAAVVPIGGGNVTLPVDFPTAILGATATHNAYGQTAYGSTSIIGALPISTAQVRFNSPYSDSPFDIFYIAIGY